MNRFFRKLPLSVKLILMGMVPFLVLIYLSFQLYNEKVQKVQLLQSYKDRIHHSASIYSLIGNLQNERKYSLDNVLKNDRPEELSHQRVLTDSAVRQLIASSDSSMIHLTSYTFLEDLQKIRHLIDSGKILPSYVTHYYSTAIFRINTLNVTLPGTDVYLQPLNKEWISQKLLSDMIMNFGIIRSNIYNALFEKKYLAETLYGMIGVHDVYKSYETEFILRGSPAAIASYKEIRSNTALRPSMEYIDTLFTKFKADSSYTAENWWKVSEAGITEIKRLRQETWEQVNAGMDNILKAEKINKNRALTLLSLALILVVFTITYTIIIISKMLIELKKAAQAISTGITGIPIAPVSRDAIGSLTKSILRIDTNNKRLISAAEKIGDGNFNVLFEPRSKDDLLGNAIVKMKNNLQRFSRENEENEQQLRQMAEKYKMIFYQSPLPKWIYDTETLRFLEVNDTAVIHYGYTHDEFLQMTIRDIRPKNDLERFIDHIKEATTTTYSALSYWRHVKKNGEIMQVEITAHVIEYEDKKARMVVVHDITERRKAEERVLQLNDVLAKSELRFRSMIENNKEIIALVDDKFRTFYRSPSSVRITGWSNEERAEIETISLVHPLDVEKVRKIFLDVLATPGRSFPISHRYRHKDGHYLWLEGIMTNRLHDTAIKGIIINLNDITERKIAEDKLIKSEKIYKTIASSIPGSIICLINTEHRYLLVEGDMLELFGYSREALLGSRMEDVLTPERYNTMLPSIERVFKDEMFSTDTSRNGYDIITRFVPLKDENNKVYAAMTVGIDVTELKNAERQINELNIGLEQKVAERTAQLETVNKELEAFTYSVSHDLRAPLRIIDGFADILVNDYGKDLDKEGLRILGVIMNNAQRMGKLIDDLLNLSRLGRKEVTSSLVDMNHLVQNVIDEQQIFGNHTFQIDKEDLLPTYCDPNLVTQVWTNLLSNAIKYSGKVKQPSIKIRSYKKDNEVVYTIKDNGAGFNMEYADKLFGVFQRLHKVSEFEGTGVGLALVQRIILKHEGKVWAESVVNEGATFFFSLGINKNNSVNNL